MSTATTSGIDPDSDEELAAEQAPKERRSRKAGRRSARRARKTQARRDKPRKPRKPPRDRPRRWPWFVALGVLLALLGGAVYGVFFSPLLGVRSVAITGSPDPLTAQVRAVVDVPDGTPLARVDLDAVAQRVEAVPEVAEVEVARGWPETLTITVTPREPVAVTSANGKFYLLDKNGDPYLAVDAPPAGLTVVKLVAPGAGDPSTVAALTVVAALAPEFRTQVVDVSARAAFDVRLTLADGKNVIWGEASNSAQKMQILPSVLTQQEGTEYDISDPTLVTIR